MTARALLTAALTVLGVYYTAAAVAQLIALCITYTRWTPLWTVAPGLGLGLLLLVSRKTLARWLAPPPSPEPEAVTAERLQVVGITLLGLWFLANGAAGLIEGGIDVARTASTRGAFTDSKFLENNMGSIATTVVGFVLLTGAPTVHGWLSRRRS